MSTKHPEARRLRRAMLGVDDATTEGYRNLVAEVIAHMRADPAAPLNLRSMSRFGRMSPFHFLRVFQRVTGITPGRFRAALRIEMARRRLLETSLSVTQIALEAGYSSIGTFTRTFTDFVGLSPVGLRKLHSSLLQLTCEQLISAYVAARQSECHGRRISGAVEGDAFFEGVIFVGVFASRIPRRTPSAGTLLRNAGPFAFRLPQASGPAYLLGAGVMAPQGSAAEFLNPDPAQLRVDAVALEPDTLDRELITLRLREPGSVDPPILVALPALLLAR